jgi:gas vesicle protein
MSEHPESTQNSVLLPFLLGGIVGAAIGLLLAPKPGSETRRQIKDFASETRDKLTSTIGRGMDIYDDAKLAVTSAVDAGKQAYIQEREKFQTAH